MPDPERAAPEVVAQYSYLYFWDAKFIRFAVHVTVFGDQRLIVWRAPKVYKTYKPAYVKEGSSILIEKDGSYAAAIRNYDVQISGDLTQIQLKLTGVVAYEGLDVVLKPQVEALRRLKLTYGQHAASLTGRLGEWVVPEPIVFKNMPLHFLE